MAPQIRPKKDKRWFRLSFFKERIEYPLEFKTPSFRLGVFAKGPFGRFFKHRGLHPRLGGNRHMRRFRKIIRSELLNGWKLDFGEKIASFGFGATTTSRRRSLAPVPLAPAPLAPVPFPQHRAKKFAKPPPKFSLGINEAAVCLETRWFRWAFWPK